MVDESECSMSTRKPIWRANGALGKPGGNYTIEDKISGSRKPGQLVPNSTYVVTAGSPSPSTTQGDASWLEECGSWKDGAMGCSYGLICVAAEGKARCEIPRDAVEHGENCCGDLFLGACKRDQVYEDERGVPGVCKLDLHCDMVTNSCEPADRGQTILEQQDC